METGIQPLPLVQSIVDGFRAIRVLYDFFCGRFLIPFVLGILY